MSRVARTEAAYRQGIARSGACRGHDWRRRQRWARVTSGGHRHRHGPFGTDVARAAADLVLLDDRFETIVHAIEHGRATFANIRRFLTYHLTDNVAELAPFVLWALSGGRIPLALGVLQILCLDLLTDQLPALALGGEPASEHAMNGPART